MLQKYDSVKLTTRLALAVVGGVSLGSAAFADADRACAAGSSASLVDYVTEIETCLQADFVAQPALEAELAIEISRARSAIGLTELDRRLSMDTAARLHAIDMAANGYAAHADANGHDHLYRVRTLDRTMLIGDFGATVLVVPIGSDAADVIRTLSQDEQNARNLTTETFTNIGVGAASVDDLMFVVLTYAAAEGELAEPMPLTPVRSQSLDVDFGSRGMEAVGWSLNETSSGAALSKGSIPSLRYTQGAEAGLEIEAQEGPTVVTLKGPLVSVQ